MERNPKLVKFCNWNAHNVLKRRSELDIILSNLDLDIFRASDTWLTPDRIWEISRYITHRCDRFSGRGDGTSVLVKIKH